MNTADPSTLLAPAPRVEPIAALPGRDKVPVTLLTGFLGAGKTTLLNRILSGDHGLRIGVLVNDFGAINIDASLVESVEENTISLVNGCVCCEVRDDLVASLEELLGRVDTVDYVILEASGVADPGGIVMTFLDWKYRGLLSLDSITCVVDAEGIFRDADDEYLTGLKLRQIAFADLVLLNKTDLVTRQHVEVVRDWIAAHIDRIRVVEAIHGNAPLEIMLGAGRFAEAQLPDGERAHDHASDTFDRWSYRSDEPFDREGLYRMVKRELPGNVYRCKGIVFTREDPTQPHVLQVVGRRTDSRLPPTFSLAEAPPARSWRSAASWIPLSWTHCSPAVMAASINDHAYTKRERERERERDRLGIVSSMGLSYWSLTLYPQAAEAGGCFNRRGRVAEGGGGEPE